MADTQTLPITNFGGRLTRVLNGDLNSGFAKFTPSFGYDPFSKPMNLTWLESPTDITGTAISDLPLAATPKVEAGILYVYTLGSTGNLYKIQPNSDSNPNVDSVVGITSVKAGGITYNKGASMQLFGFASVVGASSSSVLAKLYVGGDGQVNKVNIDGSAEAIVGTIGNYVQNRYRPLTQFVGKLVFGNGNSIGIIDSTGTVTSPLNMSSVYSELNPDLPPETYVTDLDLSMDGNYTLISTSGVLNESLTNFSAGTGGLNPALVSSGNVYYWNGLDQAATSVKYIGGSGISALQTYLDKNMIFTGDAFGSSLNNDSQKILSLPNNKLPSPNATAVNGNFVTWVAPELSTNGTNLVASMYYFGSLDQENPPGLFRVMRFSPVLANGFIIQAPLNTLVNRNYTYVNSTSSSVLTVGYGKHYVSLFDRNSSTSDFYLLRFLITSSGSGTPQLGVYETQTQLFSKKVTAKQVRVYCEPTVANNGFQIDLIGSDGNVLSGGTLNYTFAAGNNEQAGQGSLERITLNPTSDGSYALGVRVTNTGTTNMTIKKIELDIDRAGK